MLKTDKQMERVKGRIIHEQVRIKKFEEKKQKLQNIKFSKSVRRFILIQFRSKIINIKKRVNIERKLKKELRTGKNVN